MESSLGVALLPVRQELGFGLVQARRAPARIDALLEIDVHGDGAEPAQIWQGVALGCLLVEGKRTAMLRCGNAGK